MDVEKELCCPIGDALQSEGHQVDQVYPRYCRISREKHIFSEKWSKCVPIPLYQFLQKSNKFQTNTKLPFGFGRNLVDARNFLIHGPRLWECGYVKSKKFWWCVTAKTMVTHHQLQRHETSKKQLWEFNIRDNQHYYCTRVGNIRLSQWNLESQQLSVIGAAGCK